MSLFVLFVASIPWLLFAAIVALLVATKSLSWGRAAALLIATFVGAVLLKWGALASLDWITRTTQPAGDAQAGVVFLPCACWIDAPLLFALGVWALWGALTARHREVKRQRALDLVKREAEKERQQG